MTTDAALGFRPWSPAERRDGAALDARDLQVQLDASRALVEHRRSEGDVVSEARIIDHLAVFPSKRAAKAAGKALERAGYSVDAAHRQGLRVRMQFSGRTAIDVDDALRFTAELLEVTARHGGSYGGWCANWFSSEFSLELYRASLSAAA